MNQNVLLVTNRPGFVAHYLGLLHHKGHQTTTVAYDGLWEVSILKKLQQLDSALILYHEHQVTEPDMWRLYNTVRLLKRAKTDTRIGLLTQESGLLNAASSFQTDFFMLMRPDRDEWLLQQVAKGRVSEEEIQLRGKETTLPRFLRNGIEVR